MTRHPQHLCHVVAAVAAVVRINLWYFKYFHPSVDKYPDCVHPLEILKQLEECRLQGLRKLAVNANVSG